MNNVRKLQSLLRLAAAGLLLGAGSVSAQSVDSVLLVDRGSQKLMRESGVVTRVAVGDPAIADVNVINRRELLITGKTVGSTSLIVWPESSPAKPREYVLRVSAPREIARSTRPDPELTQAQIDAGKSLQGTMPNLLAHRRAKLQALNGAKEPVADTSAVVGTGTQVLTEVKISEISRSTAQQFGLNVFKNVGNTSAGLGTPGSLSGMRTAVGSPNVIGTQGDIAAPLLNAFNLVVGDPSKGILGILSVLERKGMSRVLAEPSLLATSGQTASYLAGGEFPVPVSQGNAGSITIEYKEFGVRLKITPTVLSRDRIALKVAPEVSDLDFSAGIQVGGVAVPALTVRRTDTTVELGDGESFVISGLVSSNLLNNVSKVPWLGDLPVLGAFFRSTSYSKEDKELIMVVTPRLVRPLARGTQTPALPGAKYDRYDPNFAETMLLENGNFNTGFSR